MLQGHRNGNSIVLTQKQTHRPTDRIENPEITLYNRSHLVLSKGVKNIIGKKTASSKCCQKNWISTFRRLKLDPCFSPSTKICSKWIKDLNVRSKTLKRLQENIEETLKDILNKILIVQEIRAKIDKQDCVILKSFCTSNKTIIRFKKKPIEWEKIFANY
jgi:hypothetical protein